MKYLIILGMLLLTGCSGLILRDDDTALQTTGKVASRVLLCPLTLCVSEAAIYGDRQEELRQLSWSRQQADCRSRGLVAIQDVGCFTQAGYEQYMIAEQQAARQAALLWLGMQQQPTPKPIGPLPVRPLPQPFTCNTLQTGQTATTTCY